MDSVEVSISDAAEEPPADSGVVGISSIDEPVDPTPPPPSGLVNDTITITATGSKDGLYYRFWVNSTSYCVDPGNPTWTEISSGWIHDDDDPEVDNSISQDWTPTESGLYTLVVWTTDDTSDPCKGIGGMSYKVEGIGAVVSKTGFPELIEETTH